MNEIKKEIKENSHIKKNATTNNVIDNERFSIMYRVFRIYGNKYT